MAVRVLGDVLDAQLLGAQAHAVGDAAGDDGEADADPREKVHPDSVLDVVALELQAPSSTAPR